MKSASDDALNAAIESSERWEKGCGALVVLGLVLEFLVALTNPQYGQDLERWGPVIADAFVALGVVGEILFSSRASSCSSQLTLRSNERLEDANRVAAFADREARGATSQLMQVVQELGEANERAAKLEKEAAEARERTAEIERYMAGRRLSRGNLREIIEWTRPKAQTLRLLIQFQSNDPEASKYAHDLALAFEIGGAISPVEPHTFANSGSLFGLFAFCGPDVADGTRLLEILESAEPSLLEVAEGFALVGSGAPARMAAPNVYVFVGTRGDHWTPDALAAPKPAHT